MTVDAVRDLVVRGELEAARSALRAAFAAGPPADREWAEICAAAGLSELAVQAWRAVLARAPDDREALERLVGLHELRGDPQRAAVCRQRLTALGAATTAAPPPPPLDEPPTAGPTAGDLVRFVHLFGGRAGVHARMWARGDEIGYSPVHASLGPDLIEAHLRGDLTLGSYLVRQGDTTGQLVFDLDVAKAAVERASGDPARVQELASRLHGAGLALAQALRAAGIPSVLVDSGYKGRHAWVFLDPPAPAATARRIGLAWAAALAPRDPDLTIEVFPKQDRVEPGGVGNLVKLPLGVHLRTGRRCALLDPQGAPVADPWVALREARTIRVEALPLPGVGAPPPAPEPPAAALPVVPVAEETPFTEADFEAKPRLAALLSGCAVVRTVVREALSDLRLDRDERVVLEQALGHWPEGVDGANFVLERVGAPGRMGRPLQSEPISCATVRRRLARIAERVGCDCPFDVPDTYPHPQLHARGALPEPLPPPEDLDTLLERLGRLEERARLVDQELGALRQAAAAALRAAPGGTWRTDLGRWWVEDVEGLPVVRFAAGAP